MYIRKDLISTNWPGLRGERALKLIYSRFKWESESRLRFINSANLDCIFEIRSTDPKDESVESRYLQLISAVKIDNKFDNQKNLDSPHVFD